MTKLPKWPMRKSICFYFEKMLGYPRGKQTSSKYTAFMRPDGKYYFVGQSGAIRVGKNVSTSVSVTDSLRSRIIREVDAYRVDYPEEAQNYME